MIPYRDLYHTGRHRYTHEELQANLRAYGLTVTGSGLEATLTGPPELLRETQGQIKAGLFLADWDGPSETGRPNWHEEDCPCPACTNRGGIPRTSPRIACRVWPEEKNLIQQAATRAGLSVDAWARETLLRHA